MADDAIWRVFVNSLPETTGKIEAPEMENFAKRKGRGRKFQVQKIVTEVYVYTDLENQAYSEACFQDLYLLGELSERQLKKLLSTEAKRRGKGQS